VPLRHQRNRKKTVQEAITNITTTPEIEEPEETAKSEETPEIELPHVKLALRDSPAIITKTTIDKLFTISHRGGEQLPADSLRIEVYDRDYEIIDSLKFKSSSKRFEGKYLRSTAFFDERLDPRDTIAILETLDFFNLPSHSILNVKIIDIPSNQILLEEQVELI